MTKKLRLLLVFALFSVVLTDCGAKVHTETSFHAGGTGKRVVFLEVAMSDEGKIEGGFEKLESTLKEKAPSCIQINGYEDQKKKAMVFELKYEFSDIEDYKAKTKTVTGKEPTVQWEEENRAFGQKVSYSDDTTTDDLINWVKTALQEESIGSAMISELYEEDDNVVSFEGENVWTGTGTAAFEIDKTMELKEVSVYTSYNDDGICTKQIKLSFDYQDYMVMDTEEGLAYLHGFSDKFKVDPSCNGFSVTLTGQKQLEKFFKKASGELSTELSYDNLKISRPVENYFFENSSKHSIYMDVFSVKEVYNFNQLLAGFQLGTKTIKDYVSIPKRDSFASEQIHHTYALEATKAYNYIGEYPIRDTYYLYFQGGKSCKLSQAAVEFSINEELAGTQKVTLEIQKNGMKLTNQDIMEYYCNLGEKVQVEEENDITRITFVKKMNYGKKDKVNDIVPIYTFKPYKSQYEFTAAFSLEHYFPETDQEVLYRISLPNSFSVEHFIFNGQTFKRKELKAMKDGQQWTFEGSATGDREVSITLDFQRVNMIFYGVLCIVVLLLIGTGLSVYFYVKSNRTKD